MTTKTCRKCGRSLDIAMFNMDAGKRKAQCKDCTRATNKAYRQANAERLRERQKAYYRETGDRYAEHRRRYRFSRHGLTAETFDTLLAGQGGGCAICGALKEQMTVDHDHGCCPSSVKTCGRCVRGIVCHDCNLGLGKFGDDPARLTRAAMYLPSPEMQAVAALLRSLPTTQDGWALALAMEALPQSVIDWAQVVDADGEPFIGGAP